MTIIPSIRYADAQAAIEFLQSAFDFELTEHHLQGDRVAHAELRHGDGVVMVGSAGGDSRFETGRAVIYAVVADPDAHHDRARAAGAEIVQELTDQDYGSREYAALDPEGNVWSFGTYDPLAVR